MNRRQFIKTMVPAVTVAAIALTGKDDQKEPEKESLTYTVYLYQRKQGEWVFSQNIKNSLDNKSFDFPFGTDPYIGLLRDGKLYFESSEKAVHFVYLDAEDKKDRGFGDLIYDIYHKDPEHEDSVEFQVAHYWFNKSTSSTIHWSTQDKMKTLTNHENIERA